jgi:predicted transcriptional regulator
MVSETKPKGKPKGLTNYRAAKLLGITASHLWKVTHKKRESARLMRRYEELKRSLGYE